MMYVWNKVFFMLFEISWLKLFLYRGESFFDCFRYGVGKGSFFFLWKWVYISLNDGKIFFILL